MQFIVPCFIHYECVSSKFVKVITKVKILRQFHRKDFYSLVHYFSICFDLIIYPYLELYGFFAIFFFCRVSVVVKLVTFLCLFMLLFCLLSLLSYDLCVYLSVVCTLLDCIELIYFCSKFFYSSLLLLDFFFFCISGFP